MSYKPSFDSGNWKCICDVCGRIFKATEILQRWDNLKVCSQDWEMRQPQDFVKGIPDLQAPPFTKPEQSNVFITTPVLPSDL